MGEVRPGRINWFSWHGVNWQAMRECDRVNDKRTSLWAFAWVVSLAIARLPVASGQLPQWTGWVLGTISLAVAIQFIRAYLRMVREADELLRQVQLEGLAVGFGAGLICGLTEMTFTRPSIWWGLAILLTMSLSYVVSVLWLARAAAREAE